MPLTKQEPNYHQPIAPDLARTRPRLAIVVPCFNEELVIGETVRRLAAVLRDLREKGQVAPDSFLFFVDDGSVDRTWGLLCELNESNPEVKGLKLARNFGHQNAVLAGLLTVRHRADCVISMDADLQHDEQAIYDFRASTAMARTSCTASGETRATSRFQKKSARRFFYWLMTSMGAKVVKDHPDYRLISARVLTPLPTTKRSTSSCAASSPTWASNRKWSTSTCTTAPPAPPTIRGEK